MACLPSDGRYATEEANRGFGFGMPMSESSMARGVARFHRLYRTRAEAKADSVDALKPTISLHQGGFVACNESKVRCTVPCPPCPPPDATNRPTRFNPRGRRPSPP